MSEPAQYPVFVHRLKRLHDNLGDEITETLKGGSLLMSVLEGPIEVLLHRLEEDLVALRRYNKVDPEAACDEIGTKRAQSRGWSKGQ